MDVAQAVASELGVPLASQQARQPRYVSLLDEEAALGLSATAGAVVEQRRDSGLVASELQPFDTGPVGFLSHDEFTAGLDPGFEDRSCLSFVHFVTSRTKYTKGSQATRSAQAN